MRRGRWIGIVALLGAFLTGCASSTESLRSVEALTTERLGVEIAWDAPSTSNAAPSAEVQALLKRPLDAEQATRIALLNNSGLRAALERLGIASAERVTASLPPDLEVSGELGFRAEDPTDLGFSATEELTRLITLPLLSGAAEEDEAVTRLEVASAALDLAWEVRVAFYEHQAALEGVDLVRSILEVFALTLETMRRLDAAGNITPLELAAAQADEEDARLALTDYEVEAARTRERLNVLLGLSGADTGWTSARRLPEPPAGEEPLEGLEGRVVARSLDLQRIERRYAAEARRLDAARLDGLLPELRVGVSGEREEGTWDVGPAVSLRLPLFDHGQGETEAGAARLRALAFERRDLATNIRAEARVEGARLLAAQRRVARFREVILPLRAHIVLETQRQYNGMQIGLPELFRARIEQLRVMRRYIDAVREYWQARATLDQLLAGRMPPGGRMPSKMSFDAPEMSSPSQNH